MDAEKSFLFIKFWHFSCHSVVLNYYYFIVVNDFFRAIIDAKIDS